MTAQAKQALQPRDETWSGGSAAGWHVDWPKPPRSKPEESAVIDVTWAPEVVFLLDKPRRKAGPPPLPASKKAQHAAPGSEPQQVSELQRVSASASRDSDLFSLDNLRKLNKAQLAEERRAPAGKRQPPPPPWARQRQAAAALPAGEVEQAADEDPETLGVLVRRSTSELAAIAAGDEQVILSAASWQSSMAITPRSGRSWHLEATLLAMAGTLAAVIATLAAMI